VAKTKDTQDAGTDKLTTGAKGPVPVHVGGDTILDRLMPHITKILVVVLLIALVLTGVFGYRWWQDRGRRKATTVLAKAIELDLREVKKVDPDDKPDPTKKADPTYATYKDRATAVLGELARGAGPVVSDTYRGSLLLDAGRFDDAEKAFRTASTRKDLEGVLAREGLGFVAEARAQAATDPAEKQRQLEAALAAFQAVQLDDKGLHRDHALYHEARILALLDKKPEAVAALEKALEVAPDTELESAINDRLAQLEAGK